MASIEAKLPEDLIRKFERIANKSDDIVDQCLQAGADVAEKYVRNNLREVLSAEHKNGELINALGTTTPKTDRNGVRNIKVGFAEPRKDQGGSHTTRTGKKRSYYERTNAMIASVLEYGRSNQKARPFMQPAKRQAKRPIAQAMEETFDREVNNA